MTWYVPALWTACVLCLLSAGLSLGRRPFRLGWVAGAMCALAVLGIEGGLWVHLARPPLRSLAETRLAYAAWLVAMGWVLAWRVSAPWLRAPMLALAALFLALNAADPGTLDRTLPPSLLSPWFVPHVVTYLGAYALLSLAALAAAGGWWRARGADAAVAKAEAQLPLRLAGAGLCLLTLGLVMGALWARDAWGRLWAWDPKETWAFLSWAAYLVVVHEGWRNRLSPRAVMAAVVVAFLFILGCWFALNHLPAAQRSIHTYAVEKVPAADAGR